MANKRTAAEEAAPEVEDGALTLNFDWAKETKGTHVFQELTEEGEVAPSDKWVIGSLYVKKSFFEGNAKPRGITITIQAT